MRYVRTDKSNMPTTSEPKSRLVLPGHRDPQLGLYRTDAPTTTGLAVLMTACIAVSMDWTGMAFDGTAAFLSGKKLDREVCVRAPKEGIPALGDTPAVRPYSLLRILRTAYGLTEAPRAW